MDQQRTAAKRLLETVRRHRADREPGRLAAYLHKHWSQDCLVLLLAENDHDVIRSAILCLGLIGDMASARPLANLLGHENPSIIDAAEDALWSIWFRQGGPIAQAALYRIEQSIHDGPDENVVVLLTTLIEGFPNYAEAYHQRGQLRYIENDCAAALQDARRAHELNPFHFAALALSGHCYAELGRLPEALKSYHEARKIYPRMSGMPESIQRVRERLAIAG